MGMYYGGQNYIFSKNLQGDVIGIYNENRQLVAKYSYNAYGEIMSITDASGNDISTNASHIANINPFRYRGYYYDNETGFYYLQTRYYDPVVGRFLNADAILGANGGVIGYNSFAYCNNNPLNFSDDSGNHRTYCVSMTDNGGTTDARFKDYYIPAPDFINATDDKSAEFVEEEYERIYKTLTQKDFFEEYMNGELVLIYIDDINMEFNGIEIYTEQEQCFTFGAALVIKKALKYMKIPYIGTAIEIASFVHDAYLIYNKIDEIPLGMYETYTLTVNHHTNVYYHGIGMRVVQYAKRYIVYYNVNSGNIIINAEVLA